MQHIQNGIDVQTFECSTGCQGSLFVTDVQCAIVEPDIRFDGDGTHGECAVERHVTPVVVVAVQWLGDNALGQTRRIVIEGAFMGLAEYVL